MEAAMTRLGHVCALYGHLEGAFRHSPFLLSRNLAYLEETRGPRPYKKPWQLKGEYKCEVICAHLSSQSVPHVNNTCHVEPKRSAGHDAMFTLIFLGFHDSCQESEWETINATVDVFVVHQWRKSRKSQSGRKIIKLFEGLHVTCNGKILEGENQVVEKYSFLRSQLFRDTDDFKILYSYILLKFHVVERRVADSTMNGDVKRDQPYAGYAVNYEAKFPFYKLKTDYDNFQLHLLSGDYEMRLEVSMDQPNEHLNDPMEVDSITDQLSDSSERFWVTENVSQSNGVKEYNKWPRIIFKLESSLKSAQAHSIKAAIPNGILEYPKEIRRMDMDVSVSYKFFHKDQLLQWTHLRSLKCPWCKYNRQGVNFSSSFNCLLKHLQTFHSRLSFKCNLKSPNNAQTMVINVSLNQRYDGSVEIGLRSWAGRRLIDRPERKLQFTHIIYCKLMEKINSQVKDTSIDMRPLLRGHNRHYISSTTGFVKSVKDMQYDSEEDDHPLWLRQMYDKRIEEFTDVNPGEKRIMQLWNSHLLDHKYYGDYMVASLVKSFVLEKGMLIHNEKLRHNLLLHTTNLVEYGLLTQKQFIEVMDIFDHLSSSPCQS